MQRKRRPGAVSDNLALSGDMRIYPKTLQSSCKDKRTNTKDGQLLLHHHLTPHHHSSSHLPYKLAAITLFLFLGLVLLCLR